MSPGRVVIAGVKDPLHPHNWSGISAGLAAGLRAHKATVTGVSSSLGPGVDAALALGLAVPYGNRGGANHSPPMDWIRSQVISRRVLRATPDGVIQLGTSFRLGGRACVVTLEDATVVQTLGAPGAATVAPRGSIVAGWVARQRAIYEEVRACCCASAWTKRSIVGDYGIAAEKVHVVGFGRNVDVAPAPRDWTAPRFLWIGRDWERKNGPGVLRAFASVRRERPEATIDFVGGHPPMTGHDGVRAHGSLERDDPAQLARLRDLLALATVFVMPSRFEPFGIVYVEAGAAGVPSIGTTEGGAADAVGSGGVLVDPEDDEALLRAMLALSDPDRAQSLGRQAIENASGFTWEAVAERVLAALGLD